MVSVCLVSSVISWMPKSAAAHIRDLPMCVLAGPDRGKGTCECAALFTANTRCETTRCEQCECPALFSAVVCVIMIRRVTGREGGKDWERKSALERACQRMQ